MNHAAPNCRVSNYAQIALSLPFEHRLRYMLTPEPSANPQRPIRVGDRLEYLHMVGRRLLRDLGQSADLIEGGAKPRRPVNETIAPRSKPSFTVFRLRKPSSGRGTPPSNCIRKQFAQKYSAPTLARE